MNDTTLILGIESSCDDTAAAVVASDRTVLSSIVLGQTDLHSAFGGVVPEIAARAHAEKIDHAVERALAEAGTALDRIDAIAVTSGPGLIGGVMSGVMTAKGLAAATAKPLYGINHLAGHALTPRLTDGLAFPYLMLLVSGGHCQFLIVHGPDSFEKLGGTIDDAPGEAFDKTARVLGLPQPGGPAVEVEAEGGDPDAVALPRPLLDRDDCNMSFSGLKTAVLRERDRAIAQDGGLRQSVRRDICAAFVAAVADVITTKSRRAIRHYLAKAPSAPAFAVAGGVAANKVLRARLTALAEEEGVAFVAPPLRLCTDNAAMIAWAAHELHASGRLPAEIMARPRWPLDEAAAALVGSGKKGPKG